LQPLPTANASNSKERAANRNRHISNLLKICKDIAETIYYFRGYKVESSTEPHTQAQATKLQQFCAFYYFQFYAIN
jgi:hypothetical protein